MFQYDLIKEHDPELASYMYYEYQRQADHMELIASENFVSPTVMAAMGSPLTNKYAEGYPGKRYYGGCMYVDMVEELARQRLKQLFGADHANVQPHSGAQANMAVYNAFLNPGDTVLGMSLAHGGHLTHGSPANASGKLYHFIPYGLNPDTERIDYDEIERLAHQHHPKMIVAGASAYSRIIDFERIGRIAKDVNAIFMVDMAHIAGLVATGLHPNPVPFADVVTSTTHKTLRGPRGGIILCKEEYAKDIDKSVFPGMQGGPLMHIIAAKAACFGEALQPSFKEYQKNVVSNAQTLANNLTNHGLRIVSGGTDNHLMLVDLTSTGRTGKEVEALLDSANITVNKNSIPNETRSPFVTSGIRIGTPAVTTRGLNTDDMVQISNFIAQLTTEGESAIPPIHEQVRTMMLDHFTPYI